MIELRVQAGMAAASSLTPIKLTASRHPGEHELEIQIVKGGEVIRRLNLGRMWRYDASAGCVAALGEFGDVTVT